MTNARNTATIRSMAETETGRGLLVSTELSGFTRASQREATAMNAHNANDNAGPDGRRAEDRIRIVLKGLSGQLPVDELCRREGISTRLYYQWCVMFLEAGKNGLRGATSKPAPAISSEMFSMAC